MADRYVFRSTWHLAADPDVVYAVLADVAHYPLWWPGVRDARRVDDHSGELTVRGPLPYDLVFTISAEMQDAAARILRARMAGDLIGFSQWRLTADGQGCRAIFDEDVSVTSHLLRRTGRVGRPVLRLNHSLMMRAGERGLRGFLRRGVSTATELPDFGG